ncbi:hypothetical protein AB0M12_37710 [Nocardia vinacea]|uniref:hypothetical protein n=1 Tax=Nocardia vinacea TaxID=96468 RepID=UPI00343FF5CA
MSADDPRETATTGIRFLRHLLDRLEALDGEAAPWEATARLRTVITQRLTVLTETDTDTGAPEHAPILRTGGPARSPSNYIGCGDPGPGPRSPSSAAINTRGTSARSVAVTPSYTTTATTAGGHRCWCRCGSSNPCTRTTAPPGGDRARLVSPSPSDSAATGTASRCC